MKHNVYFTIPLTRVLLFASWISFLVSITVIMQLWYLSAIIALSIIIFAIKHQNYPQACAISFIFIGCITLRIEQIKKEHTLHHEYFNQPTIITGTISKVEHLLQHKQTTSIRVTTKKIYTHSQGDLTTPRSLSIQMPYYRGKNLEAGQKIKIYNLQLAQPSTDQSNFLLYAIKEGIWATAYITSERLYIFKQQLPWYSKALSKLSNFFDSNTAYLYNPLFLGKKEKDYHALYIQHQSMYWGIAHHMARSGIHLVTLLGFILNAFHFSRIRSRFKFGLCALLALAYAYISIPSISFIRSLCMIMIQMLTRMHGYIYSGIHAFACTTLATIIYNPYQACFLDFQLSFGITGIIIWLFYTKWRQTIDFNARVLVPY